MTMSEHEAYVRSKWDHESPFWGHYGHDGRYHVDLPGCFQKGYSSPAEAWRAAYEFTIASELKIAEIEEEIERLTGRGTHWLHPALERVLIKLKRELADKQKGMKPREDGKS